MRLNIKNEKLNDHFDAVCDSPMMQMFNNPQPDAHKDPVAGKWGSEHPESMLFGYLFSLLSVCRQSKIELDLTYDTIHNLPAGLNALFLSQKERDDHHSNVDMVAKTLASVLSYLAINEHGCWFRTTRYLDQIRAGKIPNQPLWANVDSIAVGKKSTYTDFLPCCIKAVRSGSIMSPDGFTLQTDGVVSEYKKLTGVDLTKCGLGNVFVN